MVKEVACTIAQSKKEPGWQRREVFWTDAFRNGELIWWPYVRRVASWARKKLTLTATARKGIYMHDGVSVARLEMLSG